ncbi:uncharacterized protein [Diadema antillarum]|uniref:uncharacterized protein n=1 Tax=Diadema antillarum TaxID=105358 RepID=UPI003A88A2F7
MEVTEMSSARIFLWCAPRTTSNVFAKSLTAIPGIEVWIEPFQFAQHALNEIQENGEGSIDRPIQYRGNEALFQKAASGMSRFFGSEIIPERLPYDAVKRSLEKSSSKYVFVKDMGIAMHSDSLREYIPAGFKHAFLIRHPTLAYRSFRNLLCRQLTAVGEISQADADSKFDIRYLEKGPKVADFFLKNHELWKYIRDNVDPNPVVVDSSDLLANPAKILPKFCDAVGLPYSDSLLSWNSSPESYRSWILAGDRIMEQAENFVGTLIKSTGFSPPSELPLRDELTDDVAAVSDSVMSAYEEMYATRIM